jgi:hypothetical protein
MNIDLFYERFGPEISDFLPVIYYTNGDMTTGSKCIILEDLSSNSCQTNILFFEPNSPFHGGKDFSGEMWKTEGLCIREILTSIITCAAKLHAQYTNKSITHIKWLRGSQYFDDSDTTVEDNWQMRMRNLQDTWTKFKSDKHLNGVSKVIWSTKIIEIIEASLCKVSWPAFKNRLNDSRNLTLVHGDFHPANMHWRLSENNKVSFES